MKGRYPGTQRKQIPDKDYVWTLMPSRPEGWYLLEHFNSSWICSHQEDSQFNTEWPSRCFSQSYPCILGLCSSLFYFCLGLEKDEYCLTLAPPFVEKTFLTLLLLGPFCLSLLLCLSQLTETLFSLVSDSLFVWHLLQQYHVFEYPHILHSEFSSICWPYTSSLSVRLSCTPCQPSRNVPWKPIAYLTVT